MRRLMASAALMASFSACHRTPSEPATIEQPAALASIIHMADPLITVQLVKGFHEVEGGVWRWTKGRFAVNLRPPVSASTKGADLVMKFSVPEVVIKMNKDVTVNVSVNGERLPPAAFRAVGDQVLKLSVPASALTGDAVRCEFVLDKTMPPSPQDQRELGVIVSSIGLLKKP